MSAPSASMRLVGALLATIALLPKPLCQWATSVRLAAALLAICTSVQTDCLSGHL
jgi:hypothetical protein